MQANSTKKNEMVPTRAQQDHISINIVFPKEMKFIVFYEFAHEHVER